jgi:3-hydroxyisobutyrate dehydrogenase-like beta-hydroxyacid dehydrogenase
MTSPDAAVDSPPSGSGGGPTLGMVGLGRMGANMVRRLQSAGIATAGYDPSPDAVAGIVSHGAVGATSLEELVGALSSPRVVWIMVPAAVVDTTVGQLTELLSEATSSSTAATATSTTASVGPASSPTAACATSTWGPPAASSGSSAATA